MAPAKKRTGTKKTSSDSGSSAKGDSLGTNDASGLRMETDGVLTPIKADFASPESPVLHDPASWSVEPGIPEKVESLKEGETAAQYEAHVLVSSPGAVAERIERESGPDGVPTDVVVAEQAASARQAEFQRVAGTQENPARNPAKSDLANALRTAASSLDGQPAEPVKDSTANSPTKDADEK